MAVESYPMELNKPFIFTSLAQGTGVSCRVEVW